MTVGSSSGLCCAQAFRNKVPPNSYLKCSHVHKVCANHQFHDVSKAEIDSYVPQRCFVETCYLVGWCSALPTFQGRTWLMCYTVGSKLLKKLCCDSVLKPSEEVIWRKVPPNNPVSMQLSALQKLEVVSHTDCRACLFTSLSIQMIDGLFFLIQWNVFQGCAWIWPFVPTMYCATMWHCFFDWWLYDNVTMSNEDSLRPRIHLIICESWLRWFNEKEFPLESNLLIVGTAHRSLFWAEKNLWGCRNIKESRLNRSGQRHMPQDHFRTQSAFKWALKHQFANEPHKILWFVCNCITLWLSLAYCVLWHHELGWGCWHLWWGDQKDISRGRHRGHRRPSLAREAKTA